MSDSHAREDVWLRIDRGRVAAVGRGRPATAAVDLGDAIILPGLVNAHTHLEFSDRSAPLDTTGGLPAWIGRIVAERRVRPAGDATAAIRRGLAESAAAGVTSLGDIATVVTTASHAGPGPAVRVFREGVGLGPTAAASVLSDLAADLDRLAATGLTAGISPHAPYSVTASLGRRLLAESRRRRLPVAMHLLESDAEAELLTAGGGPLRRVLDDLGAWDADRPPRLASAADWIAQLARSPRGIVVHATHLGGDATALAALARHRDRLAVVVCPRTTWALSGRAPPIGLLAGTGIRVAIGTDSRASNPDLCVLAECRSLVDAGLAS
ncbi:MAG: amidohydrolase family protein, partial [Planctomycetes bacterium]|nr:amidohydrolase family protein [Planctomycetota bacterium]